MAGRLSRQTWPADLASRLGRYTWLSDLTGRLVKIIKIEDGLKIENQHDIVSFQNRLKARVALLEPLDLSNIALGNVWVPTCCLWPSTKLMASGIGMTILHPPSPPLPPTICNIFKLF
jgi:hypothetical protein